jgi:hypothetical protein
LNVATRIPEVRATVLFIEAVMLLCVELTTKYSSPQFATVFEQLTVARVHAGLACAVY